MLNQGAPEPCLESFDALPHQEEFDDPDFDVMAELDCVSCDDLFDELRCDRAVRISKMEAKVGLFPLYILTFGLSKKGIHNDQFVFYSYLIL